MSPGRFVVGPLSSGFSAAVLLLLVGVAAGVGLVYAVHVVVALDRRPLRVLPYDGGAAPEQHAWSRFHARWYVPAMVFLAFDVEMLFMYPWVLVLADRGVGAVVEMFGFLAVLLAGVAYAWREGAFRWS